MPRCVSTNSNDISRTVRTATNGYVRTRKDITSDGEQTNLCSMRGAFRLNCYRSTSRPSVCGFTTSSCSAKRIVMANRVAQTPWIISSRKWPGRVQSGLEILISIAVKRSSLLSSLRREKDGKESGRFLYEYRTAAKSGQYLKAGIRGEVGRRFERRRN